MIFAERLLCSFLRQVAVSVEFREDILRYLRLFGCRGPPKDIKAYVKPFVDVRVDLVVFVA